MYLQCRHSYDQEMNACFGIKKESVALWPDCHNCPIECSNQVLLMLFWVGCLSYLSTKMWAHSSRKQKLTLLILSSAAGCVRQERSEICIFRILKLYVSDAAPLCFIYLSMLLNYWLGELHGSSTEGYGKVWNGLFGNGKGQDHNRRNSLYPTIWMRAPPGLAFHWWL